MARKELLQQSACNGNYIDVISVSSLFSKPQSKKTREGDPTISGLEQRRGTQ
jgi:hypothetical protein